MPSPHSFVIQNPIETLFNMISAKAKIYLDLLAKQYAKLIPIG
ncbi:hypothetical protein QI3_1723 [Clostridioides difficile 842]|nr:hypothetical protein QC9_1700 [Clostridioides difficile CD39]EQE96707.1 hypothetical protein QEA_1839 [Clostridioides difficile CD109]EQE97351.1 hypothetical protein QCY_1729 [Clostridioides difficile CD70]EQF15433.1 hypothetical protein QEQ_1756 [Clostridioides difficile CD144]EQF95633.1 hypothetical protein QI3_1723 [Clostridioides difficile 842]EQG20414.1 hypothetical protein QIE_1759 [Clostridioides difficile DA00062]EQG42938.1 hypothetical protein QIS_1685 [Clostridioides difficile DA